MRGGMIWVPDPATAPTGRQDVRLLVAVQSDQRLYLLVEVVGEVGPPSPPDHSGWHIRVRTASGEPTFRGGSAEHSRRGPALVSAVYDPVAEVDGALYVVVELDREPVHQVRLARVV